MAHGRVLKGGWYWGGTKQHAGDPIEASDAQLDDWAVDGYVERVEEDAAPVEAEEAPEPEADDDEPAPDYAEWTKDELVAEAEERGIEVARQDGKDGPPLKDDYIAALSGEGD